jgi:hypothetical protein
VRKNKQIIKLFFVLLFCTAFIFSSSHFGAQAYENIKKDVNKKSPETSNSLNTEKPQSNPSVTKNIGSETVKKEMILNQSIVKMDDIPDDLQAFLEHGSKIEIPEKSTFSLLEFVQKNKLEKLDSDTLSLIASGIYQSILPTNFSIEERNIGNSLPKNVSPGFEAKFNFDQNDDLAFSNPNKSKYFIVLAIVNRNLKVTLRGEEFPYHYKITENEQSFKPKTIIQYSPLLPPGKVKVTTSGKVGNLVKVYKDVYQGDLPLKRELISSDYYPPVPRVEIHSLTNTSNDQGSQNSTQTSTQLSESQSNTDNQNSNPSEMTGQNPNSALGQTIDMPK